MMPLRRAERGQESLLEILEGSGGLEEVGSPFWKARRIRRPLWRAGRGREALPESREWLGGRQRMGGPSGDQKRSEGHPVGLGGVWKPSWWDGRDGEGSGAHPNGRVV